MQCGFKVTEIVRVNPLVVYVAAAFTEKEKLIKFAAFNCSRCFLPPWRCFPGIQSVSLYYRQGVGEQYLLFWLDWLFHYDKNLRDKYLTEYVIDSDWSGFLELRGAV